MDFIRVLIADDHVIFRDGLKTLITSLPDFQLVGEADTGDRAVQLASELRPDIILMDIKMPGLSGIEATRQIVNRFPHTKILIITMYEEDSSVFEAMRAGALGYIPKGATHTEMLSALQAVSQGQAVFGPSIAARMMHYFSKTRPVSSSPVLSELSDREREILTLMAQGYKNNAIAEKLVITPKTVSNHISNIFSKLQVVDRTQAILKAKDAGLE